MAGRYEKHFSVYNEISKHIREELVLAASDIDVQVVNGTPVRDGHASGGWLVSVDTPNSSDDTPLGRAAAISQGASEIQKAKPFGTIYIQNHQPHIVRLNEGWSEQAPTKYIDKIVAGVANDRK